MLAAGGVKCNFFLPGQTQDLTGLQILCLPIQETLAEFQITPVIIKTCPAIKSIASLAAISLCLMLAGCGPKRIDGTSEETYKSSLEAMGNSLNADDQKVLAQSIMAVGMNGMGILEIGMAPGLLEDRVRTELNGKTFDEIKAQAEVVKKEQAQKMAAEETRMSVLKAAEDAVEAKQVQMIAEEKQKLAEAEAARKEARKKQIETEIAELVNQQNKAGQDALTLKKFEIQRSRFYFTIYFTDNGIRKSPVIELTVKNGLSEAISRVYFKGVLTSPGRSIPWVSDTFNYQIRGGLEPNEVATWKLSPNLFGAWAGAPSDREDMVLTVELVEVEGANAKSLYDAEFSESKQNRLEALRASLKNIDN